MSASFFHVKLQEQDVKIAALLSKEIVGSVADGDDDSAMKQVNYGSIYELYFAKLPQNCCLVREKETEDKKAIDCGIVCRGASLLPLLARLVHIEECFVSGEKMPSLVDQISKAKGQPQQAEQLANSSTMQHLVVPCCRHPSDRFFIFLLDSVACV